MQMKQFTAIDDSGNKYLWSFCKNGRYWELKDHENYTRVLSERWIDSVPSILLVLSNYGLHANFS